MSRTSGFAVWNRYRKWKGCSTYPGSNHTIVALLNWLGSTLGRDIAQSRSSSGSTVSRVRDEVFLSLIVK